MGQRHGRHFRGATLHQSAEPGTLLRSVLARVADNCAYRKSNPDILVVQPAENWAAKNVPGAIDGARNRRILLQG